VGRSNRPYHHSGKALRRTTGTRGAPKESFLIVCEGERTEPNYFQSFKLTSAAVRIIGRGYNTLSLVEETRLIVGEYRKEGIIYDQVWCVFDRDDFSSSFNAAVEKAEQFGFHAAYSNEAFELWYLLHFIYFDSAITRSDYRTKLNQLLGRRYRKNSTDMYELLLSRQSEAVRNAARLLDSYNTGNPNRENPSTTVHLLVEQLNRYL